MKRFLFLITLFIGSSLFSQDWEEILKGNESKYYYKPNANQTGWIKEVSDKITYYTNKGQTKKIIDGSKIVLYKFDCTNRQIGIIQIITYSKSGNIVNTYKINEHFIEMDYVVPDSIGEGILNSFCRE